MTQESGPCDLLENSIVDRTEREEALWLRNWQAGECGKVWKNPEARLAWRLRLP